MKKKIILATFVFTLISQFGFTQNVAINATGALPNSKAMLDIASTSRGLLIPRMTTSQRDSIASPPDGLQIYNTTTSSLEIYANAFWKTVSASVATNNYIYITSLANLPTPSGSSITLDATKTYIFSGIVNISPYYLNLNGATVLGLDPTKDGILSTVAGGVLRSTGVSVFIQNLTVIPFSTSTKAYDFTDATKTKFCNIFSGSSVVEAGILSLGVGQVSGFAAVTISLNYWNCKDGLKVTGNMGKFCSSYNFITNISSGYGIEFLSGLVIDDIDLSNNYFVYTGQTGVKLNTGATVIRGRMTTNMFRGVATFITGFDSYSPEWMLISNTDIPNTRAYCYVYMDGNATATALTTQNVYYKIAGTTTAITTQKFTAGTSNKMIYIGKESITAQITIVIGGVSPAAGADYQLAVAKNGTVVSSPSSTTAIMSNTQAFQITLLAEASLTTNDYLEVFIRRNGTSGESLIIDNIQFRVRD